jgi:site-specific DNA-cytosine methylase
VDNTEEFRCLSLCTGYAGIELGLRRVIPNLRTIAYVEVEAFAVANLVAKMEAGLLDAAPIWADIKTFNGQAFSKRIHIITAGYPCQGESHAGKRLGEKDPRWLWPYIERIIEAVEPVWFFGENVSGHLTLGFPTVYRSLRDMGYKVEAGLFGAFESCGTPHFRQRLFILAKSSRAGTGNLCGTADRKHRSQNVRQENGQTRTTRAQPASQLADTSTQGLQKPTRRELRSIPSQAEKARGGKSCRVSAETRWLSRPGQPQHEWEEPRVVAEYESRRGSRKQRHSKGIKKIGNNTQQAQPRLGRAADGTKSRVDRLRLLGNGVVPQQAEKAFRYLIELFED